jgi:drug/metabolite transporter (DMT)-like permease
VDPDDGRKFCYTRRDWLVYVVRAIFLYVVGVGLFTLAVTHTKLATVSFVSSLPILGVMAWVMFREKMRASTVPFIGLSIIGLVFITGIDMKNVHLGIGELAAIAGMVGFDLGYLMSRLHNKRLDNFQHTTILLAIGWVPLLVMSVGLGEQLVPTHVTPAAWVGLVVSAVLNIVGLYLINYVFEHLRAYVAGNWLLLEGVFALLIGLSLYGEVPTATELVGATVILACAYVISLMDARKDRLEAAQSEVA